MTKLIRQINFPSDLRTFKKDQLKQISNELRDLVTGPSRVGVSTKGVVASVR